MPLYDECFVLLPTSTLEDFPVGIPESDARSLLAAWTVLWHPQLIAGSAAMPTWYRADEPPSAKDTSVTEHTKSDSPVKPRVIAVPQSSLSMLPDDYEQANADSDSVLWITGPSRTEMLDRIPLDDRYNHRPLQAKHRTIGIEDFFALGYAYLQVQVLTRRLRYTSNLDQIYFESCVLQAAEAFTGRAKADDSDCEAMSPAADAAAAALHDAFDCLAQERDHFFASDPHLIELTLLSASTLDTFLDHLPSAGKPSELEGVLPTPGNVLIDAGVAENLRVADPEKRAALRACFENKSLGWAGGGPTSDVSLSTKTYTDAQRHILQAFEETSAAVEIAPPVYARYSGSTPRDFVSTIASLGVSGMISNDFENATGFADEAKVVQSIAGVDLQTLAAKPIDASSEVAFLDLMADLGQSIDRGEIAAALMVHWPGTEGDTFQLVQRTASWSLVLGRMWTLDDFFRHGEQPYHHNDKLSTSERADLTLKDQVAAGEANPLSAIIAQTRRAIVEQNAANLRALVTLANGKEIGAVSSAADHTKEPSVANPKSDCLRTVGLTPASGNSNICLFNPTSAARRINVEMDGTPHADKHVYAASGHGKQSIVTADVSAFGFSVIRNQDAGSSPARSLKKRLGDVFSFGSAAAIRKPIAVEHLLQNAFMEVAIDAQSGGIKGVYCGQARGNRFSLRLVSEIAGTPKKDKNTIVMKADTVETKVSRPDLGVIESSGSLVDAAGERLANFVLAYQLQRGSRVLEVSVKLEPLRNDFGKQDPWKNYIALRTAVASEAMMPRLILRDKIQKPSRRSMVSPLGVILDESERQTLVASAGLAYHRRVDDRFLDTLLFVQGETQREYKIHYGFDVKNPVSVARSVFEDPITATVESVDANVSRGWLIHVAPKEVLLTDLRAWTDSSGTLFALVRLIQTKPRKITSALRFCRPVKRAIKIQHGSFEPLQDPMQAFANKSENDLLAVDNDCVKLELRSHEVADCLIEF
ncbi:hypothetical protein Q31b_28880 [Novipirellula aureliae]|uniref:Glycoside hydrolase family 38 N-terminal domain-containing protein n=1 Tax=Novipirellula aureliae TaxID=2527966 RepID=A0A5C6E1B0_9BACT|nr:hypothetical protein [Novipirellula aureliae]TWU41441.1 hypothetical protein Q31b_28880 [Novipirellula aureliae]